MATGYEKILALIQRLKFKEVLEVSEVSSPITLENIKKIEVFSLKPEEFQSSGPEVSEGPFSPSFLPHGNFKWIEGSFDLALTGELTRAVLVPVLPAYQKILGEWVWFCPEYKTAEEKKPYLAFTPQELIVIIPLLFKNREFASTLVSAKRIFGGTIMESSLLDSSPNLPQSSKTKLALQQLYRDDPFDPVSTKLLYQNMWIHRSGEGDIQLTHEGPPGDGWHFVKIVNVKGYLYNFQEYTGPRAYLEMKILNGPDAGKMLKDKISLPHPEESEGRRIRRLRIKYQLGLISRDDKGTKTINWKLLEGKTCWVDVVHNKYKGRVFPMVKNYQLVKKV